MLDDTTTPGKTLCVFCRMEARPTIWSVVDSLLNTDNFDDENFPPAEDAINFDDSTLAGDSNFDNESVKSKKTVH